MMDIVSLCERIYYISNIERIILKKKLFSTQSYTYIFQKANMARFITCFGKRRTWNLEKKRSRTAMQLSHMNQIATRNCGIRTFRCSWWWTWTRTVWWRRSEWRFYRILAESRTCLKKVTGLKTLFEAYFQQKNINQLFRIFSLFPQTRLTT